MKDYHAEGRESPQDRLVAKIVLIVVSAALGAILGFYAAVVVISRMVK